MTDRQERNVERFGVFIHDLFGFKGHAACALVKDSVLRPVVKQARHGNTLLEAARKDIAPFGFGIPAFRIELNKMFQAKGGEDREKVGVVDAL